MSDSGLSDHGARRSPSRRLGLWITAAVVLVAGCGRSTGGTATQATTASIAKTGAPRVPLTFEQRLDRDAKSDPVAYATDMFELIQSGITAADKLYDQLTPAAKAKLWPGHTSDKDLRLAWEGKMLRATRLVKQSAGTFALQNPATLRGMDLSEPTPDVPAAGVFSVGPQGHGLYISIVVIQKNQLALNDVSVT